MDNTRVVAVGFTTEQGTANLVPAIQIKATHYVAIHTQRAFDNGWGDGVKEVLERRGVQCDSIVLSEQEGKDIEKMRFRIRHELKEMKYSSNPICWLIGGGQKVLQLSSFTLFLERTKEGILDESIYADPHEQSLSRIRIEQDGTFRKQEEPLRVDLDIDDIARAFNRRARFVKRSRDLSPRVQVINRDTVEEEYRRFRKEPEYRNQWLLEYEKSCREVSESDWKTRLEMVGVDRGKRNNLSGLMEKNIEEWLRRAGISPESSISAKKLVERLPPKLADLFLDPNIWQEVMNLAKSDSSQSSGGGKDFPVYFEMLVKEIIQRRLEPFVGNRIVDFRSNVGIFDSSGSRQLAEYDVLVALPNGTLRSLDAKTYSVEKKDLDARLINLHRTSGQFASYAVVFPWFREFLEENWTKSSTVYELARLPIRCRDLGLNFCVVTSEEQESWIRENPKNKRKIEICSPKDEGAVKCRPLEAWLDELLGKSRPTSGISGHLSRAGTVR